ncbi:MAG TPA: GNAT family N-acetyltransferase [Longimicrobium sp.]|nr:GNAT family N-acetyltransferase [Longimicrobium sp.]
MTDAPTFELETPRLRIHALGEADAPRLQAVFQAAADHFVTLAGAEPDPDAAARELAGCAASPGRRVALLTLADGSDVGAVGWWEGNPEPDVALLGMLFVTPGHRGEGLAREALGGVEILLAGRGFRRLRTAFPHRRLAVRPVVQALGFREMSIADHQKLGLAGAGTSLWEKEIGR